jgi:methionyl-tRNA synthetase
MIAKNCGGVLPEPGAFSDDDKRIVEAADALLGICRTAFAGQQIHHALNAIWAVVADANRYFAASEPWALRKTDPARMGTVLYVTAEVIRQIALLTQPVMPASSAKLLALLAVGDAARTFASLGAAGRLAAGTALPAPQAVFPRYVEEPAKD